MLGIKKEILDKYGIDWDILYDLAIKILLSSVDVKRGDYRLKRRKNS